MKKGINFIIFVLVLSVFVPKIYSMNNYHNWQNSTGLLKVDEQLMIKKKIDVENSETIEIEYSVPELTFSNMKAQSYRGENTKQCLMGNALIHSVPGEPLVPYISPRVILPYGKKIKSIEIISLEKNLVSEKYLLGFGEVPQPISSNTIVRTQANSEVYESNSLYPVKDFNYIGIQDRFGVSIAKIDIFPVKYSPKERKVEYFKRFKLRIETEEISLSELKEIKNGIRIRKDRFVGSGLSELAEPEYSL